MASGSAGSLCIHCRLGYRKGEGLDLVFVEGTVRVEEFRGQAAYLILWLAWIVIEQGMTV